MFRAIFGFVGPERVPEARTHGTMAEHQVGEVQDERWFPSERRYQRCVSFCYGVKESRAARRVLSRS